MRLLVVVFFGLIRPCRFSTTSNGIISRKSARLMAIRIANGKWKKLPASIEPQTLARFCPIASARHANIRDRGFKGPSGAPQKSGAERSLLPCNWPQAFSASSHGSIAFGPGKHLTSCSPAFSPRSIRNTRIQFARNIQEFTRDSFDQRLPKV